MSKKKKIVKLSPEETYSKDVKEYIQRIQDGKLDTKLKNGDLEVLKKKMLRSIELDTQQLVMKEKFISGLVLRMPVIPVRDCRVNTALTDGTNIYFDIDFYTRLSSEERIFVLAHEVWHNALLHFTRRQNREPDTWNIATDCEINYALKQDGFTMPNGLCYPTREMEGKCAEEIYDYILQHQKKNKKNQNGNGSGKNKNQNGSPSSSWGSHSSGGYGDDDSEQEERGKGYTTTSGNHKSDSEFDEQFDNHMDKENEKNEYGSGAENGDGSRQGFKSPRDKWGEKGFDKDFKPVITDEVADKIREMVISEAQRYERTKGSIPGGVQRIIDSICKPEVRWEELLSQFVTTCLGDKRQWLPPLRRAVYDGMYFQSRRGQKINVTCIVDTSGSTTADLPKFLTELVSLLDTFGTYELSLIHCDCAVQKVETYDQSNPFPVDNPKSFVFEGGGGSDLRPAFDEILNRGFEPSCCIVFTDGYIDCPEENPIGVPTLFVLTNDGAECCSWAKSIRFKARD